MLRTGFQNLFYGFVAVIGLLMLLNYKRIGVVLGLGAVMLAGATVVYLPQSGLESLAAGGSRVLTWVASQFA